jgi:hypothetical protein
MESIVSELTAVFEKHLSALRSITADEFNFKPSPSKWSKKEILGHLTDSAQNNIRRFIVAQYEEKPKITYNQDKWVAIADYQHYNLPDLIQLWWLLNKHICHVLKNMPAEMAERESQTEKLHTIKWLAQDYIKHLKHHLHQILNLEPVPYP